MGDIIYPWGQDNSPEQIQDTDGVQQWTINDFLAYLGTTVTELTTALPGVHNATRCFDRYLVYRDQCQRVVAVLQSFKEKIDFLIENVREFSLNGAEYSITNPGIYVSGWLEDLINAVWQVYRYHGSEPFYEGAWKAVRKLIDEFPSEIALLLEQIPVYSQEVVRVSLGFNPT